MEQSRAEISIELSRLIERQTKFFEKSDPTLCELQEFEWAGERIRKLLNTSQHIALPSRTARQNSQFHHDFL
jgi:hypothetical protein